MTSQRARLSMHVDGAQTGGSQDSLQALAFRGPVSPTSRQTATAETPGLPRVPTESSTLETPVKKSCCYYLGPPPAKSVFKLAWTCKTSGCTVRCSHLQRPGCCCQRCRGKSNFGSLPGGSGSPTAECRSCSAVRCRATRVAPGTVEAAMGCDLGNGAVCLACSRHTCSSKR